MPKYKTAVTDYEGMQGVLDAHAEQGWRLFSVTPDTWRKTVADDDGMDSPPFQELNTHGRTQEYSASYYLLVFQRDDLLEDRGSLAAMQELFPVASAREYDET